MLARALFLLFFLSGALQAQDLNEKTYKGIRDFILPDAAESRWEKIQWHRAFWPAVVEAHRNRKPIMIYAMNGNTLGCT